MTNTKKDIVKNNLDNIKKWISEGKSIRSIADALDMSKTTLYKYINELGAGDELDIIKSSREIAIDKLESTIYTSATGFTRKVKKYEKLKRCTYEDGKKANEWEEMVEYEEEIYYKPDMAALIFLLKNWAKYMNEPKLMELREKEVQLREKQVDNNIW